MTFDPTRQVFVLSSPASTRAAQDLLSVQTACALDIDWAATRGCKLVLWPDNNPVSIAAMRASANLAAKHGAAQVKLIVPGQDWQPGWGASVAAAEGLSKAMVLDRLRAHAQEVRPAEAPPAPAPEPVDAAPALPPEPPAAEQPPLDGPLSEVHAMLGLETTKSGPVANEDAVMRCLERHPNLRNVLWYDDFLGRIMTWDGDDQREWTDADDGRLLNFLQRDLGISKLRLHHVRTAVITHAFANMRNCVQEWLADLTWDGVERISHFFPDYCGTPDTAYARAVSRNFWISMVARALRPGCKVDNMVVLEGKQGDGKSSMLKAIAGDWFTVQHESVTGKGFFEVLQGKLLVEIAEMDAFGKAEVTRVKQVVTTESDRYREAYGRYAKDHPRHSVFAGSTNKDDWNRDETGARRFWPVPVTQAIDIPAVMRVREQCFAEAVAAFDAGDKWWETPEAETIAEQDARREEDPWTAPVADWLGDTYRSETTIEQVLSQALELRRVDHTKSNQMRVASILRGLKWTKHNAGGRRYWARPEK